MKLTQEMAGYSLGRADVVRKAMGKKKLDLMAQEREVFIYGNKEAFDAGKDAKYAPGCINNGIEESVAIEVWNKMADFAKYAFNRSHADCYAYIALLTAWLSYYYPCEFYAGMLNAFNDSADKFVTYLNQINQRNIKMLPPDINLSEARFSVDGDAIRFGLRGIKGVNKEALLIKKERDENGPFKSFQDLYERMHRAGAPIEKKSFEGLLYSGALDCFGHSRAALLKMFPVFVSGAASEKKTIEGQMSLFSGDFGEDMAKYAVIEIPEVMEIDKRKLMEHEQEMLGFYLSGHPVDIYESQMPRKFPYQTITEMQSEYPRYGNTTTVGLIRELRHTFTKNGDLMYFLTLENRHSRIPCVVFPKAVQECQNALVEGQVALVEGRFIDDEARGHQIIINNMIPENEVMETMFKQKPKMYIPVASKEDQDKALELIHSFQTNEDGTRVFLTVGSKLYPRNEQLYIHMSMNALDEILRNFPKAKLNA